jgi:hypothetical protein
MSPCFDRVSIHNFVKKLTRKIRKLRGQFDEACLTGEFHIPILKIETYSWRRFSIQGEKHEFDRNTVPYLALFTSGASPEKYNA